MLVEVEKMKEVVLEYTQVDFVACHACHLDEFVVVVSVDYIVVKMDYHENKLHTYLC